MADNIDNIGRNINAMGLSPYDIGNSSKEGGDNREGALGQTRATGIIARGNAGMGKRAAGEFSRDSMHKSR